MKYILSIITLLLLSSAMAQNEEEKKSRAIGVGTNIVYAINDNSNDFNQGLFFRYDNLTSKKFSWGMYFDIIFGLDKGILPRESFSGISRGGNLLFAIGPSFRYTPINRKVGVFTELKPTFGVFDEETKGFGSAIAFNFLRVGLATGILLYLSDYFGVELFTDYNTVWFLESETDVTNYGYKEVNSYISYNISFNYYL